MNDMIIASLLQNHIKISIYWSFFSSPNPS